MRPKVYLPQWAVEPSMSALEAVNPRVSRVGWSKNVTIPALLDVKAQSEEAKAARRALPRASMWAVNETWNQRGKKHLPTDRQRWQGGALRGYRVPNPQDQFPVLYHVTPHVSAILGDEMLRGNSGFERGGLGGAEGRTGVSFTPDRAVAARIYREYVREIQAVRTHSWHAMRTKLTSWAKEDARRAKVSPVTTLRAAASASALLKMYLDKRPYDLSDARKLRQKRPLRRWERPSSLKYLMHETLKKYRQERGSKVAGGWKHPVLGDPQFLSTPASYAKLRPENVAVLAVPAGQIPRAAFVRSVDDAVGGEVTVFSDVPVRNVYVWRPGGNVVHVRASRRAKAHVRHLK